MIRAVLFDYGGVLSPAGGAESVATIVARALGLPPEKIHINDLHALLRMGNISVEDYLEAVHERYPDRPRLTEDVFMESSGLLKKCEPMYELAERLRAHGIKTGILSNVFAPTARMLEAHGNYAGFDPILLSCFEHLRKPDKAFYRLAAQRLDVQPGEVVMVDDQEKCATGAHEIGMEFIIAVSPEQTIRDVEQLVKRENGTEL